MDHKDLGKAEKGQLFGEGVHAFALLALEPAGFHLFSFNESLNAIIEIHASSDSGPASRY